MSRMIRILGKATVWLVGAGVFIVIGVVAALASSPGNEWIRQQVLDAAAPSFPHGELVIDALDTNLLGHIELLNVEIRDANQKQLVQIDSFLVEYNLLALLNKEVAIGAIRLEGPNVDLSVNEAGEMDLLTVFGPAEDDDTDEPTAPFEGLPVDVTVEELAIVGARVSLVDPAGSTSIPEFSLSLQAEVLGSTVSVTGIDVDVDLDQPIDQDIALDGGLSLSSGDLRLAELAIRLGGIGLTLDGEIKAAETKPNLDLRLLVDPMDPSTLEALAGQSLLKQPITLEAGISGPLSGLVVDAEVPSPQGDGKLGIGLSADLESEPLAWGVKLTPVQFEVHNITDLVPAPFVLDGNYTITGTGTDYPSGVDADIRIDCGPQVFAGEQVDAMNIHGRLDAGRLGLDIKEVIHEVAKVSLVANVNLLDSMAKARASVHIPNASKLRKYGVQDMGGSVRYEGDIEAAWEPDVDVDVEGELTLSSFAGPGVFIETGGGPIHARLQGEHAEGSGDVRLEGLDASGTKVDAIQLVFEGSQSAAGNVDVTADLQIGVVSMPDGQFDMQGLDGKMTASIPSAGEMQASADMNVKTFRFGDGDYSVDGGPVHFDMVGDHIETKIDLRRRDAPFLAGTIAGDLQSGLWSIDGFQFALLEGDGFDAEQSMQFRLADDGAKDIVVEIANAGGKGRLKLEGQATSDNPDISLIADKIDLSYIVEMVGQVIDLDAPNRDSESTPDSAPIPFDELSGLASMDLKVQGEDGLLNAAGWIEVEDLILPGYINKLDTRIDVALTNTDGSIRVQVADDDQMLFWSKNDVPIVQKEGAFSLNCDEQLELRSILPGVNFRNLAKQIPAIDDELRGRASLDVHLHGNACDPAVGVVAAMDTAVGAQGERVRLDIEFERDGDNLQLKTAVEQEIQRIAEINAVLATHLTDALERLLRDGQDVDFANTDTWLDSFYVNFDLQKADVGRLARMGAVTHPIEGTLEGGFELSGTMSEPKFEAGIVWADGRIGEAQMSQFTIDVHQKNQMFDLKTVLDFVGEGGLEVEGKIPLELRFDQDLDLSRPGLQIDISGDGIPLAMAAGPTGLAEPSGTINLGGTVSGSLDVPTPKLTLGSSNAGFTLLATGLRYEPLRLGIEYDPENVTFHDVSVRSQQLWGQNPKSGTFTLEGTIGLDEEGPTEMSIETKMEEFWVSATRQANIATSGGVQITGRYPDLDIRGQVAMDEASIAVGEEILKDTSGFEVDETIQLHREKREVVAIRRKEEPEASITDNFNVDLQVDLAQKVRMRADVPLSEDFGSQFSQLATLSLDIGLDGLLDISQQQGVLSVVGELATMRGEMVAMGKRFTLTEGDITFTGENYVNPQLSILAAHQVGQYGAVDIAISGDVENTSMELSSVEYPDQTDVMSMLLFGKPTSAMSETEGESGSGLLSAAMASVGGQAARATGAAFLQNVQIDPGSGSVKVGFPLTDKIYLSIEKVTPEEDTDNVTQAALEWILSRQTYGELITGDRGQSSGDLYWRWRF